MTNNNQWDIIWDIDPAGEYPDTYTNDEMVE